MIDVSRPLENQMFFHNNSEGKERCGTVIAFPFKGKSKAIWRVVRGGNTISYNDSCF